MKPGKTRDVPRPKGLERFYLWGIKAVIFAVPFLPLYVSNSMLFPYITGKNFAFRTLVEIAAVLWLGLIVLKKEYRLRNSAIVLAVLIFTFITGLAGLTGANPYSSLWSDYERMDGYITILHLCLYFIIIKSVFRTGKDWSVFLGIFAFVSILVDCHILFQMFGYLRYPGIALTYGTIGNTAFLAGYLLLSTFVKMILIGNTRWLWLKIIYASAIFLDLLIIYYAASRGVILSVFVGVVSFSLFYIFAKQASQRDRFFRKMGIAVIIGIIVSGSVFYAVRNTGFVKQNRTLARFSAISTSDPSTRFRLLVWESVWEGIKERPVLGWGQENVILVYTKYYNPELRGIEVPADRAHNIILEWLINAGVLGLLSYLGLFGASLFSLWSSYRSGPQQGKQGGNKPVSRNEAIIISTGFIVYFFQNLFVFDTIITYIIFFALLAYIDNLSQRENGDKKPVFHEDENAGKPKLFGLKTRSLSAAVIALAVFSSAGYFITYKPIKVSQTARDIMVSFGSFGSIPRIMEEFDKALSYGTYGDRDVIYQMAQVSKQILEQRLLNQKGAVEFVQKTALEMGKIVEVNPGNVEYMLPQADLLNRISEYDRSFVKKAETYIKECLGQSPRHPDIYSALADNNMIKGDYEGAYSAMKKAVDLNPSLENMQLKMALVELLTSRKEMSDSRLEDLRAARIKRSPQLAAGKKPVFSDLELLKFARLASNMRDLNRALRYYSEIIAFYPERADYRFEIANIHMSIGDKESAIKEVRKAAELDPNYVNNAEQFIQRANSPR